MGAIVAATLTAAGSAIFAVLQTRTLLREADVLRREWDVETGFRLPNLRRDAAQSAVPAPAGLLRRAGARALAAVRAPGRSTSWEAADDESDNFDASDAAHFTYDPLSLDDESDTVLEEDDFAEASEPALSDTRSSIGKQATVSPDSLAFAPFLLDTSALAAWGILWGVLTIVGLVGPQLAPGATQVGAMLIPLATLGLAALYPVPWAWAAVIVGLLQGANAWGYALAGGTFQAGDAAFCVVMYLANAAAVALLAAHTMQRHRRWIVMRAE